MTYNIHLLSHICVSVCNWGRFWIHTAFVFESRNRKIIDTITSPNGIAWQIYTRCLMTMFKQNAPYDPALSEDTRNFISDLLNIQRNDYNVAIGEARIYLEDTDDNTRRPLQWEGEVLQQTSYQCSELTEFR